MQCPLCGYVFDAEEMTCHSSCAFNRGCSVICCPNCGYSMVDESRTRLGGWLQRRLKPRPEAPAGTQPLSALRPGQSATVAAVNSLREDRLSAFGIIPGALVTLRQRQPAFVLRVGFTDLSLERAVAETILVENITAG